MTPDAHGPSLGSSSAPRGQRALRPGSHRLARVSQEAEALEPSPLESGLLDLLVAALVTGLSWLLLLLIPGRIEGPLLLGFALAPCLGALVALALRAPRAPEGP